MGRYQAPAAGTLSVVGMPIGNRDDLSRRALATLRSANLIACEDTRRIARLLTEHRITTPTRSYFEHNEERRVPEIVGRLLAGDNVALVTDAGTPAISDPGYRLVRAALDAGVAVTSVPGPSAVIAALSIAGLPTDRFVFEGFLPQREAARRHVLEALANETRTLVFLEAARRLKSTLTEMALIFGAARQAAVVREITKTYEETVRGSLEELAAVFTRHDALGEITLVIEGAPRAAHTVEFDEAAAMAAMREAGISLKQASGVVAKLLGTGRREIYQRALRANRAEEAAGHQLGALGIRNVLFDLDGTLSDPGEGIARSIRYALGALGYPVGENDLRWCVGPPLREIFARLIAPVDNQEQVERAVRLYIDHYACHGALECKLYEGVPAMLAEIRRFARMFVVTSKNTEIAEQILTALELRHYFAKVIGVECDGRFRVKADAVRFLIDTERLIRSETAIVGDREHDILAGRANGIIAVGVTYGYGTSAELVAAGTDELCECPGEVNAAFKRLMLSD